MSFSWQGASNRWYEFDVAKAKRAWEPVGGVYMFVKPSDSPTQEWGGPVCLFIAKTNDFAAALARHEMWAAAQQLGAAEVHILQVDDDQRRLEVEQDLLSAHTPILNRQMLRRVA